MQIAHGYAKATGKPMAVILHDLVGLLHACMAIYYAYIDRVPIFIIGATGPMDEAKRRPHIDWTHSALVQGNAVRDYVKWDYQPTSIEGVPESFARAYSIMTTEPQGPVYVLRRGAAGGAAGTPGGAAARRRRRHAGTDGARSARDRGDRRQAAQSRASDAARRICRPARRRVREHRGAGRAHRRGGMGRQQRAQLSQQASALPEHGQGVAAAHRPGRRPRRQRLGKAAHRAQQRQAHARADHAAVVRFRRDRLRRDQHQQVGDGLLPDAAVLDPGARRHRARHSGADPHLPEAHRRRHQAASASRHAASRSASGTTKSGRSGRKRRARTGTPRRSPSHGWRSRSGR